MPTRMPRSASRAPLASSTSPPCSASTKSWRYWVGWGCGPLPPTATPRQVTRAGSAAEVAGNRGPCSPATVRGSSRCPTVEPPSRLLNALEHQRGVGAAEAEAVRHHRRTDLITTLAHDRESLCARIDGVDVGRAGNEAVLHHQQAVDSLVHAGRSERVAAERLG